MSGKLALATLFLIVVTLVSVALRSPAWAYAGGLFMKPIDFLGQFGSPFLFQHGMTLNVVLVGLLSVAALSNQVRGARLRIGKRTVLLLACSCWFYAAASLVWSAAPERALESWRYHLPYIILSALIMPMLVRTRTDVAAAARSIFWLGLPLAIVFAAFGHWEAVTRNLYVSWSSTEFIWDPLAFGELSGALMIASAIGPSVHTNRSISNLLRLLGMCVALVLVVFSGSRGQMAAMILISLILAPAIIRKFTLTRMTGVIGATLVLVAIGAYTLSGQIELDSRWGKEHTLESALIRTEAVRVLFSQWLTQPEAMIFGLGNGSSYSPTLLGMYPHVVTLEVLAEQGFIGFALFMTLIVISIRNCVSLLALVRAENVEFARAAAVWVALFWFSYVLSWKQGSFVGATWLLGHAILVERIRALVLQKHENSGFSDVLKKTNVSGSPSGKH